MLGAGEWLIVLVGHHRLAVDHVGDRLAVALHYLVVDFAGGDRGGPLFNLGTGNQELGAGVVLRTKSDEVRGPQSGGSGVDEPAQVTGRFGRSGIKLQPL